MIATRQPPPLDPWRRRFGGQRRQIEHPRHAALGYMAEGPVENNLIEVGKLTIVILYPCQIRSGLDALRLAGFSGTPRPVGCPLGRRRSVPLPEGSPASAGARWTGAAAECGRRGSVDPGASNSTASGTVPCIMASRPCGNRFNCPSSGPVSIGLRRPASPATAPNWRPTVGRAGRSPEEQFHRLRRDHHDLVLWPLAWVSHHWRQAVTIYADLDRFPRRQVFRLENLPDDLAGFQGAAEFDFASRFNSGPQQRSRHQHQPVLASAV